MHNFGLCVCVRARQVRFFQGERIDQGPTRGSRLSPPKLEWLDRFPPPPIQYHLKKRQNKTTTQSIIARVTSSRWLHLRTPLFGLHCHSTEWFERYSLRRGQRKERWKGPFSPRGLRRVWKRPARARRPSPTTRTHGAAAARSRRPSLAPNPLAPSRLPARLPFLRLSSSTDPPSAAVLSLLLSVRLFFFLWLEGEQQKVHFPQHGIFLLSHPLYCNEELFSQTYIRAVVVFNCWLSFPCLLLLLPPLMPSSSRGYARL